MATRYGERFRGNEATVFQVEARVNVRDFGAVTRSAVSLVASRYRDRARKDIAAAGHFPRSYISGLTTRVMKVDAGWMMQARIWPSFMKMYEYGGTSVGKPFLWLPIPPTKVHVNKYRGRLIHPSLKSRVLLRRSDRKPLFVAISSVSNRQRLHLRKIASEEAAKFRDYMMESPG